MAPEPVYIFDAYGTLLDVSAAARAVLKDHPGDARLLAEIWRGRQLEYAWTDMALGHPTSFWDATGRALDTALALCGLDGDPSLRNALLAAYAELDAYPDALPALQRIAAQGGRSVIYSNANPAMLEKSVASAGLSGALEGIISVDGCGLYKPHRDAYAYIQAHQSVNPGTTYFVSSNPWDAAGSSNAGFLGLWINRLRHPYPFPKAPVYRELESLAELPL